MGKKLSLLGANLLGAKYGLGAKHGETLHLLITDMVMPGMGGRALAEALVQADARIRVLYVSGYTDNAIVHKGILEPGLAFLPKPYTPQQLARKVREVLRTPESIN